ncbi:MAG: hypothetical protein DI535_14695 [Citrobacter freundii]|nr:MAG: hypothetical protein DI535_14695 [Citrobacter freundii]
MKDDHKKLSKILSYTLRHHPEKCSRRFRRFIISPIEIAFYKWKISLSACADYADDSLLSATNLRNLRDISVGRRTLHQPKL